MKAHVTFSPSPLWCWGTVQAAGFNTPQSGASYKPKGRVVSRFDNAGLVVQNPSAMVKLETGIHVYGGFARYETHYNYKDLNGEAVLIPSMDLQWFLTSMHFIMMVIWRTGLE